MAKRSQQQETATKQLKIEPLMCTKCNAPLPLNDGDVVQCPYCSTEVPILEEFKELRNAVKSESTKREEAERLYKRLGAPPGKAFRVWGEASPAFMGILFFLFIPLFVFMEGWVYNIGLLFHVNLIDLLSNNEFNLLVLLSALLPIVIIIVLAMYGRKYVKALLQLKAALAAGPPARKGGSRTCRFCSAPLTIKPQDIGVQCNYCGADNLVSLPAKLVEEYKIRSKHMGRYITDAAQENKREKWRILRRSMVALLLALSPLWLILILSFSINAAAGVKNYYWPPLWRTAIKNPPGLIPRVSDLPNGGLPYEGNWEDILMPANKADTTIEITNKYCDKKTCTWNKYIALRYGQIVKVNTKDLPAGTTIWFNYKKQYKTKYGNNTDWFLACEVTPFAPDRPFTFTPPLSAWYSLVLEMPKEIKTKDQYSLEINVANK